MTLAWILIQAILLKVQKVFAGDYANAEPVTINVADSSGTTVATHTFASSDFTRLASGVVTLTPTQQGASFECDENYTISETMDGMDDYTVSFAGTNSADATIADSDDNAQTYTFTTSTENDVVTVVVTNTWKTDHNPPITGFGSDSNFNRTLLIALAAAVTVAAGGYGVYRVYKPKKENE